MLTPLAVSDVIVTAGAALGGVVIGACVGGVVDLLLQRRREKAEARAGARLVQVELSAAASRLEAVGLERAARDGAKKLTNRRDRRLIEADAQRPRIIATGRGIAPVADDALRALVAHNTPPEAFVRDGLLTRTRVKDRKDADPQPVIEPYVAAALRDRLDRCAQFVAINHRGENLVGPSRDVAENLLTRKTWPGLALLTGITEAPTLRPDGTILDAPGYDEPTGLYHHTAPSLTVPPVTGQDTGRALALLDDLLAEFPFDSDASRANALALLLTPILRPAIPGPTPLALVDAPAPGTGTTLLARLVSIIATGRELAPDTPPATDEEWRKVILTKLLAGAPLIVFEEAGELRAASALLSALTGSTVSGRLLGTNTQAEVENRAVWIVTGNNLTVRGDLARRCYRTRLDARVARPWERDGFRHPRIVTYAHERRGDLLWALLEAELARGANIPQTLAAFGGPEAAPAAAVDSA